MKRICVVHQNDGTDVRVGKMCRTLSQQHDVFFLGWNRDSVSNEVDLGSSRRLLFALSGSYGGGALLPRLRFLLWMVAKVWEIKPATVVVVNEELGLPLGVLKGLFGFKIIVDVHDPLADRLSESRFRKAYVWTQARARKWADLILVTDENRYDKVEESYKLKTRIIPNYPDRPCFDVFAVRAPPGSDGVLRIAAIGSLHENRGTNVLRAAVEKAGGCSVELAGWFTDEVSKRLGDAPYATYHGLLKMQKSLELIASCDLVFCFYNPKIVNNVNASPNKIYEAVCMGKMSIVNSEARISQWVQENNFGYVCDYLDISALVDILDVAKKNIAMHRRADPRLVKFAQTRLYWEHSEDVLLAAV